MGVGLVFKKGLFAILLLLFCVYVDAAENQRVIEELNSPMPEIPLKRAMGAKAYSDAISSGEYNYVGNSKCRLCHRNFFIGRKKDPHDHAMESLIALGEEKNSHCLMCHSTGHGMPSGFVDMEKTPRLANVQCEGCHGPGNVHIALAKDKSRNETKKFTGGGFLAGGDNPEIVRKLCTSCHTSRWNRSYHDIDKVYNSYKKADRNTGH
ncbi:MAG: cytochrome c family protein [Sulfurimonas sp.]|uniref:cytochrome c family protein n=1 Tax=Sulfurimonas sp. TaxID=2022749 RepID=UPI0028CCAEEE|nr:cytochrome c family protein [Sulfurimonas sp.]MDT8338118.1 cytochrome c family protein [Sulfurimonas sp.]